MRETSELESALARSASKDLRRNPCLCCGLVSDYCVRHQLGTYAVGGALGTRNICGGWVAGRFVIGIGVCAEAVDGCIKIGPWADDIPIIVGGGAMNALWHSHSALCGAELAERLNRRGKEGWPFSQKAQHPDSVNSTPLAKAKEAKRRRSMVESSSVFSSEGISAWVPGPRSSRPCTTSCAPFVS